MNANLTIKGHDVTINGNFINGDTYPIKSFIKDHLRGKWDGTRKGWSVDLKQVEKFMADPYLLIKTTVVSAAVVETATRKSNNNGWCNKCHSYCWGDCDAH